MRAVKDYIKAVGRWLATPWRRRKQRRYTDVAAQAMPRMELPNDKLLPLVREYVEKGESVIISVKGYSMRPFLESQRDKAILTSPQNLKVGDPVLAEVEPGHYVLHRIISIKGENVTLMGDGNLGCEHCKLKDFRAGVVGFYRKGRTKLDRIDGTKWKVYSWFWTRLRPIRRYLLAAYRRIWLKIFKVKLPEGIQKLK